MNDGLKRTKTELKPCPFCGGKAEACEGGINGRMRVYGLVEHKDSCFFLVDGLPTKYQHITESDFAAWNTRAERTCRNVDEYAEAGFFTCGVCGFGNNSIELTPNYCPECGARVVE